MLSERIIFRDDRIREEGREEGWKKGREEGREEGRAEGRNEGRAEGRNEGRAEGRAECLNVIKYLMKNYNGQKSDEEIINELRVFFNITPEAARKYLDTFLA